VICYGRHYSITRELIKRSYQQRKEGMRNSPLGQSSSIIRLKSLIRRAPGYCRLFRLGFGGGGALLAPPTLSSLRFSRFFLPRDHPPSLNCFASPQLAPRLHQLSFFPLINFCAIITFVSLPPGMFVHISL
jgi:hypothetical protein